MKPQEGDTFWYHICPVTNRMNYVPIGAECPDCKWSTMSVVDKAKIRQAEYKDELKGDLL